MSIRPEYLFICRDLEILDNILSATRSTPLLQASSALALPPAGVLTPTEALFIPAADVLFPSIFAEVRDLEKVANTPSELPPELPTFDSLPPDGPLIEDDPVPSLFPPMIAA
jgi:hypothetical protein